jgi:hypothetical protein
MSGLLHRLAATATGKSHPVRANARLPFNNAALVWTAVTEAVPAPRSIAPDPTPVVPPPPTGAPHAAEVPPLLPRSREPPAEPVRADPALSPPEQRTSRASRAASLALPNSDFEHMADPPAPEPLMPLRSALMPIETSDAAAVPPAPDTRRDPPHQGPSATTVPRPNRDFKSALMASPARAEPSALLPRAAPRSPARYLPVERPRNPDSDGASEGTEVHIHIGRIDVTAAPASAPPPPRPKARSIPPPLSLDEYLAKRRRT